MVCMLMVFFGAFRRIIVVHQHQNSAKLNTTACKMEYSYPEGFGFGFSSIKLAAHFGKLPRASYATIG